MLLFVFNPVHSCHLFFYSVTPSVQRTIKSDNNSSIGSLFVLLQALFSFLLLLCCASFALLPYFSVIFFCIKYDVAHSILLIFGYKELYVWEFPNNKFCSITIMANYFITSVIVWPWKRAVFSLCSWIKQNATSGYSAPQSR